MNNYEILTLMDTYKVMQQQGLDVPDTMTEFLAGITPIGRSLSSTAPLDDSDELSPRELYQLEGFEGEAGLDSEYGTIHTS